MRTITMNVGAGGREVRALVGRYVRVMDASAELSMQIDGGPRFDVEQGIGIQWSRGFSEIAIESATAQAVTLAVSDDGVDDSRLSVSAPISVKKGANATQGTVSVGLVSALLVPADATRRSLFIRNDGANPMHVSFTGSAATASNWKITPGGGVALDQSPGVEVRAIASGGDTTAQWFGENE